MLAEHDHRALGAAQDLFHFQDEAPGMVFWHPRGLALHRLLEQAVRRRIVADGYGEVRTPQLLRQPVWEKSGHWQHFREDMFQFSADGLSAALKPVSCPGHIQIVKSGVRSYRDLPLRYAELGLVHRNEQSGALHGLFRLRQFTQDDGHVFCAPEQARGEVVRFLRGLFEHYRAFGFEADRVLLSTRPPVRGGDDADWDWAETVLGEAAREAGASAVVSPGGGAFYGPKLELVLSDRLGREWQCGTVQLDVVLPERFDVSYVAADGARRRPVILHRAIYGSLERFLGILLEHHAALPAWLAPEQVVVVGLGAAGPVAAEAVAQLRARDLRARLDARDEPLGRKVKDARALDVPFVVVIGDREAASGGWAVRARGGGPEVRPAALALDHLAEACRAPL